ncbi:hypothetical protein FB451DRAFT_1181518 [Mycena latifolia]|nr:hypothetical protein FB451DRAFT_1181518 [Mycena latifolia]
MDIDAYILAQQDKDMEEEEAEADWELAGAASALILIGAEEARRLRAERRKPSRLYLCRPQLLRNPRFGTPWQAGFGTSWYSTPIPREDVRTTGNPRPGACSLDAPGALGLVLHYLNSTMREISLQQIFALIPTTVSHYIHFGLKLLLAVLRKLPDAAIQWPRSPEEFQAYNDLIIERPPRLTGAFASIDGVNLPVQTAEDEEMENATYNGWLCEHFISSVLVLISRWPSWRAGIGRTAALNILGGPSSSVKSRGIH